MHGYLVPVIFAANKYYHMFHISLKSAVMFVLISIAWYFGFQQLWFSLTHISEEWPWLLVCTILPVVLYDLFLHLILAHRQYEVDPTRWLYKILVFLITVDIAVGSPLKFIVVHRGHHAWADQPGRDILYPGHHWYGASIASPIVWVYSKPVRYPKEAHYFNTEKSKFTTILNDPWTIFCEKYTIPLVLVYWGVLYLFFPILLFKFAFLLRAMTTVFKISNDLLGHLKIPGSYRNFNIKNNSYNNIFLYYLFLGLSPTTLHNNHHSSPDGKRGFVPQEFRWYEVDLGHRVIKLMQPFLTKKFPA